MSFAKITGIDADKLFGSLGVRYFKAKYEDMILDPDPLVSDDSIQSHTEFGGPLQDPEALKTYTLSCDRSTLTMQLATYRQAQSTQYQAQLDAAQINQAHHDYLLSELNKTYSLTRILEPKARWFLSSDQGATWIPLRSLTQDQIGAVRFTIKLVALGIQFIDNSPP